MKKSKLLPIILMLFAGAVTSIVTYLMHYEIKAFLWILAAVLVSFYIAGCIIRRILDSFMAEEEKSVSDEGEVIEKEPEPAEEKAGENVTAQENETAREA